MQRVPAAHLSQQLDDLKAEYQALSQHGCAELTQLVSAKGWLYAKRVAKEIILEPYECDPPMAGEDSVKWDSYNKIRWAFERFFSQVEALARGVNQTDV